MQNVDNGKEFCIDQVWEFKKMCRGTIVVYGCGGHARSIVNTIHELCDSVEILLVDQNAKQGEMILGCKTVSEYELSETDCYIIAIGDNKTRSELYQKLNCDKKGRCISVISKHSCIGMDAVIGKGVFVGANAYIGPQAEIGNNTIINTGSIIEHEVKIGSHTHIAPHTTICGQAKVGNHVFCGAGTVVIDKISICDNAVIGAGAVVKENIADAGLYVGVPAKKVSRTKV